jgi:hypothetical protein
MAWILFDATLWRIHVQNARLDAVCHQIDLYLIIQGLHDRLVFRLNVLHLRTA